MNAMRCYICMHMNTKVAASVCTAVLASPEETANLMPVLILVPNTLAACSTAVAVHTAVHQQHYTPCAALMRRTLHC
jgi:hypothetical protein